MDALGHGAGPGGRGGGVAGGVLPLRVHPEQAAARRHPGAGLPQRPDDRRRLRRRRRPLPHPHRHQPPGRVPRPGSPRPLLRRRHGQGARAVRPAGRPLRVAAAGPDPAEAGAAAAAAGHRALPGGDGRPGQLPGADPLQGGAAPHRRHGRGLPHGERGLVAAAGLAGGARQLLRRVGLRRRQRLHQPVRPDLPPRPAPARPRGAGPLARRGPLSRLRLSAPRGGERPMFKQIDRLLVRGYLKSYLICLISLLSLYIVVDLFTNLDEFTHHRPGLFGFLERVGEYYGVKVTEIFDRLSEVIVLLAGMFTVAWMQRHNELLPLLSAGVSTRRVVRPVLVAATLMLGVALLNQEFLIPKVGTLLSLDKEDPDKEIKVPGAYEPNGVHLEGGYGNRKEHVVRPFYCHIPEKIAPNTVHLSAEEARYIPPGDGPRTGGWLLTGVAAVDLGGWDDPSVLEQIDPGKFFLHVEEVDFDVIIRSSKWYRYASTLQLYRELQK